MKWIALFLATFVAVPALARAMTRRETWRWLVLGWIGFDLFNPYHVNFLSDEHYRGDSRGIEITSVDLAVLALGLSEVLRRRAPNRPRGIVSGRMGFLRGLYWMAAVLSAVTGADVLRSSFSVWKLTRMYFFFSVLTVQFWEVQALRATLFGLALGVGYQGLFALIQKYVWGMVRVTGALPHPNSLSMMVNLVAPVALALALSGEGRLAVCLGVVGVSAMCHVFSLSRGGLVMFLLGTAVTVALSLLRRPHGRAWGIVGAMGLFGIVAGIKSAPVIIARFLHAPKESEEARHLFNAAAKQMAEDHPFGVGINMYSWVLDHGGYADQLHIEPGDRNGIAHHIYWLTAAELGYPGLVAYVLLLGALLLAVLRGSFAGGVRTPVGLGILVGLMCTYLQGTAEWIARQTPLAYLMWLYAAVGYAGIECRKTSGR